MAATLGVDEIDGRGELLYPHQGVVGGSGLAADQRQMRAARRTIAIREHPEFAVHGLHRRHADPFDQRLVCAAVADQIGDGADFQAMRATEFNEVRQSCHRAVIVHDLADDRCRLEARKRRHIATRLGVAGSYQYAPLLGPQRKHMAGLNQVGGTCLARNGRLNGARPVGRRNAGAHPFGCLDRDGELGAVAGAVAGHHQGEIELSAPVFGKREADEPTAKTRHEVDRFGRDELGRQHQIAFILAIFLIDQNHHSAGTDVGNDLGNA